MSTSPDTGTDLRRALVVSAHPDDIDFGSAGTIAVWTDAGITVTYCVCTSGDAGGFDQTPRQEMPRIREEEQRAAARAVGVTDVRFLGYPDGQVSADIRLRKDISAVIRSVRPQRVLTHSPEINWAHIVVSHPDHRAVGEATLAAIYPDARNEFAHPELLQRGLKPWTVSELWLSEAPVERINHAVDITDYFEKKIAALSAHRSQIEHANDLEGSLREQLRLSAERQGLPAGQLAETFHVVDTG